MACSRWEAEHDVGIMLSPRIKSAFIALTHLKAYKSLNFVNDSKTVQL